jgi:oligoribonuclease
MNATPVKNANNLIWIDLEMTGLDTNNDSIIEIATIITDANLNTLAHGPELAIHVSDEALNGMDEWNTRHHGRSGLTERVKNSKTTHKIAEADTIAFLKRWVPANTSPMCGNSICQDRRFLAREMPELEAFFHYRNLDVSTFKEIVRRWYPDQPSFEKKPQHLALSDIQDSIAEMQYYREKYLVKDL